MEEIYFNAAGHGTPDAAVVRRIIEHLELELEVGPTRAYETVGDELEAAHTNAARLIGGNLTHTGFQPSTTVGWRSVIAHLPISGKRLLVAPHEWGEHVHLLKTLAANGGATIELLPQIDFAAPDLSAWQAAMGDDVAAIFAPMVSSVAGIHYPIEAIGALQRSPDTMFIIDAAQALGQIPVDVKKLGCDALVGTTRKWVRGPRQTALLWLSENISHRCPAVHADTLASRDFNISVRLGQGVALDLVLERTVEAIRIELKTRTDQIRAHAEKLGLPILSHTSFGTGAVALRIPKQAHKQIEANLEIAGITVKWPVPQRDEPFAGVDDANNKVMRIAPHLYNTLEQIDALFEAIERTL
ncbi:MAG: aminotransferase class V-fold PLP-dependent enzyme [Stappiaceae bacterium]